jgi:hypothetical protein
VDDLKFKTASFAPAENPWVRIASSVLSAMSLLKGNKLPADSTLEAMRIQGRFSLFQGVATRPEGFSRTAISCKEVS